MLNSSFLIKNCDAFVGSIQYPNHGLGQVSNGDIEITEALVTHQMTACGGCDSHATCMFTCPCGR